MTPRDPTPRAARLTESRSTHNHDARKQDVRRFALAVRDAREGAAKLDPRETAVPVGPLAAAVLAELAADRTGVQVPPDVRRLLGRRA